MPLACRSWLCSRHCRPLSDSRSSCTTCSQFRSRRSRGRSIAHRPPARQLASRARHRVRGAEPLPDPDLGRQREAVDAFLAAARAGDFDGLVAVLDPDVVFRTDTGARPGLAPAQVAGAAEVAQYSVTTGPQFAPFCRPALVNGAAGLVAQTPAGTLGVVGFTVVHGRITTIDLILDPDKLRKLDL